MAINHRSPPPDARKLTCRECDRIYRKQHGTAANDWRCGRLPGRREGRAIMISAKRAEELYGVDR